MLRHAGGQMGLGTCGSSCSRQLCSMVQLSTLCKAPTPAPCQSWLLHPQPSRASMCASSSSPGPLASSAAPGAAIHTLYPASYAPQTRAGPLQAMPEAATSAPAALPLTFTGQVMSAASNMVRVELDLPAPPTSNNNSNGSSSNGSSAALTASSNQGSGSVALPRTQLLCSLRSLLKKLNQTVLVGDRVRVGSVDWNHGKGQVEEVFPRHSELIDPAVANVDFALLVFALNNPPFEEFQVTRFLLAQEASGIPFRLLLNKADLVSPQEVDRRVAQVRSWGYDPLVVSCEGEGQGVQDVIKVLEEKTAVLAGPSGAGKSSLINAIRMGRHRPDQPRSGQTTPSAYGAAPLPLRIPASALTSTSTPPSTTPSGSSPSSSSSTPSSTPASSSPTPSASTSSSAAASVPASFLAVGDLSRLGRGKHTTTTVTLIKLPGGGRLADTPGFSQSSLEQISTAELSSYFPEFSKVVERDGACQFSNCQHMLEPGCAINRLDPPLERHRHYLKFLLEIKEREDNDIKALQAGKRAREGNAKAKMERGGRVRAEVKLDSSKHRRTSRTSAKLRVMDAWNDTN